MDKIKKIFSFLSVSIIAGLLLGSVFSAETAQALDLKYSDVFSTGEQGLSFEEYSPTESLTLEEEPFHEALTTTSDVREYVITIVNFALGFLGLLAVIIIIYGGILYVTAAGEEEKTQKGKKAITYAAIGLIIVMGSFAIVNTIIRGAGGVGEEDGREYVVGENVGGSFNAFSVQVRTNAENIFGSFIFFAESIEELKAIVTDSQKPSLNPEQTTVTKQNILSYLFSVKEKMSNLRTKVPRFSEAYSRINETISKVEYYTEQIQLISDRQANYPAIREAWEGFKSEVIGEYDERLDSGYLVDPSTSTGSLYNIFDPLKQDFFQEMEIYISDLIEIRQSLENLGAEATLDILNIYDEMKAQFGWIETEGDGTVEYEYTSDSFLGIIEGLTFDDFINGFAVPADQPPSKFSGTMLDRAGNMLIEALEKQLELVDELQKLRSVNARLRANVVSGNAPLVVTFDVLESSDPAGGSILPKNIDWTEIVEEELLEEDIVTCSIAPEYEQLTAEEKEVFGQSYRQCTFHRPGTYLAKVIIHSNEPTQYIAGISTLVIKVSPPATQIFLDMKIGEGEQAKTITIMNYDSQGILKTDRDSVVVTLQEAEGGLTFDATATENVEIFRWNFGDLYVPDNFASVQEFDEENNPFKEEGKYKIELEVENALGEIDRKIFTLDVREIAARITMSPSENEDIFINQPVTFDGRSSSASGGRIRSYEWVIEDVFDEDNPVIVHETTENVFTYEFEEKSIYKVTLTVSSDISPEVMSDSKIFSIKSQPPVALFDYEIPEPSQPGTVHLDAGRSYDPDGLVDVFEYEWSISPDSNQGENWEGTTIGENPVIKFKEKGDYEVTLTATDVSRGEPEESEPYTREITIDNVLDIAWAEDQEVTAQLDEEGNALMEFNLVSENAIAYEIDFGDGDISSGDMDLTARIPHTYTQSGKYPVDVTVYDEEDFDNSIKKRIFIGDGENPVAKISLRVNGEELPDLSTPVEVSKKDVLTFDAGESKNTDGTGRDLTYSWDFGDTNKSTRKAATHSYDELSPADPGYYTASLKVSDKDEPEKSDEDEAQIKVVNMPPEFSSIQAIPAAESADLVTPVNVNMRLFNAEDEDGEIVKYKWWYFDVNDPDEPLGIQITQIPNAKLTIGTFGREDEEITYSFGVEVTDSDNISVTSGDLLEPEQIPEITVTNGPNELPVAKFNVDSTSVFTGDTISFTSSSEDPDGQIEEYIWDLEGDGFFNNTPTENATIEHSYSEKNLEGYPVRLKVVDDKGGEAVSDPINIYVDSLAEPPTAAFKFEVIPGSAGKKIQFINNSTADEESGAEILNYKWDFDTASNLDTADSDGDGIKDNDVDSQAENPERLYVETGTYTIKLTVTDNQGNTDEVTHTLTIPMADPPTAAFTYDIVNGQVQFNNNSTADTDRGAVITEYEWDFDTSVDSDGDGTPDNDTDSVEEEPIHDYPSVNIYQAKLTVIDNLGSSDEVINPVDITSLAPGPVTEPGLAPEQETGLSAVLKIDPAPRSDGIVYLQGESGSATLDFSDSTGPIAYYVLDKNIYYDTDGNGIKNDDQDFKTSLPGTWKTNFEKEWGKTEVKLTVVDLYENSDFVTQEIKFE
ncbi:PKD domain-containing protein [Candidatus Peregrinibacteria bacterium]|nr:PKD domain-containing protein [Candidatus Peregrinibacteria bacterium]